MPNFEELAEPVSIPATASPAQVLVVSGTAPGEPGVGGVFLDDLVQVHGPDNIHVCWLKLRHVAANARSAKVRLSIHERRYETAWRPVRGLAGELMARMISGWARKRRVHDLALEIQQQLNTVVPDVVLCIPDSGVTIQVMARLLAALNCPLRTLIWDDVDTVCRSNQLDRWTLTAVRRDFAQVLKASERIAVVSENMRDCYRQRYGVSGFVLRYGVDSGPKPDARQRGFDRPLRIGFSGSITAPECFESLLEALDSLNWQLEGRDICLTVTGARLRLGANNRQWIEYLGWRDAEEAQQRLSQCDLLYLPQTFRDDLRPLAELSFPAKLSFYVSVGRPVLLHAPEFASPGSLWDSTPLGPWVKSLDQEKVRMALIEGLSASSGQQGEWGQAIRRVYKEVLGGSQFRAGVQRLLEQSKKPS